MNEKHFVIFARPDDSTGMASTEDLVPEGCRVLERDLSFSEAADKVERANAPVYPINSGLPVPILGGICHNSIPQRFREIESLWGKTYP